MGKVDTHGKGSGKRTPRSSKPSGKLDVLFRPEGEPHIARLFHRWGERPVEVAGESLRHALQFMGGDPVRQVLLAGAGFVWARLPEPTRNRFPAEDEFTAIIEAGRAAAEAIRSILPASYPLVVFGVDIYATCTRSSAERQVGQFAVILHPDGPPVLLPKRYPMPVEETYLRVPEGQQAPILACDTPFGRAAVLVCHDINVYSPRGAVTTVYETRANLRTAFQDQVQAVRPAFGMHLSHYLETAGSFRQAYRVWASEVGIPLFGATGLPPNVSSTTAAELASSLLSGSDGWAILDLLERPTE